MSVKKEVFADGLGQVHFTSGMVRYDFVSIQPGEDSETTSNGKLRIIMPLKGFLAAHSSMQEMISKMVDAGVLTKKEPEKPAKPARKSRSKKK